MKDSDRLADPSVVPSPAIDESEEEQWDYNRFRVTFRSVMGAGVSYDVWTRFGEYKAVAIALRYHLLGPNDFYADFPRGIRVDRLPGTASEPHDLGDPAED